MPWTNAIAELVWTTSGLMTAAASEVVVGGVVVVEAEEDTKMTEVVEVATVVGVDVEVDQG